MVVSTRKITELNEQGWVLYHSPSCGYCEKIRHAIGPLKWNMINKIDCSKEKCIGIRGVPTWVNSITHKHWSGRGVFV